MNENITVIPDESLGGVLREYREVKRKARAGELIKIINNVADHGLPIGHVCKAKNADYAEGWSLCHVDDVGDAEEPDYVVLEPVEVESALLSTQPAMDQIAENIAALTTRIQALESRVAALEDERKLVKVASGPVDRTPPSFIALKTPQQIRDEIVEQAKDDVKALLNTPEFGIEALDGAYISYIPHIHRVKFVINRDKRTIVALVQDGRTDKLRLRGIAKCAPGDVFNAHIGRAIALRRALGLEVPAEYLNAPNPTEVRVGDVVDYGGRIATVALDGRSIDTRTHTFISTAVECDATIIDDSRESEKGAAA